MFEFIPICKQLIKQRNKAVQAEQDNERNKANIDYIAMMCDVELSEPETMEVDIYEQEI